MNYTLWHRPLEPESPTEAHPWCAILSDDHAFLVDHIAEDTDRRSAWRIVASGAKRPVLWTGGGGRAVAILPPAWPGQTVVDPRVAWCEKYDWLGAWACCERADWMLDGFARVSPMTTRAKRTEFSRAAETIVRPHLHHQPGESTLAAKTLDMAAAEFGRPTRSDRLRRLVSRCRDMAYALRRSEAGRPSPALLHAVANAASSIDSPVAAAGAANYIHTEFPPDAQHASRDADIVRRFLTPDAVYLALSDVALSAAPR